VTLLARETGLVALTITVVTERGEFAVPVSARVVD
jgi:hypothetical protein